MAKSTQSPIEMIQSTDFETIKSGAEVLQDKGKLEQLPIILKAYLNQTIPANKKVLYELLASIAVNGSKEAWLSILKSKEFAPFQAQVVNILWNTRIDFSQELEFFVQLALQLDYLGTLECLTLIEQMEGPFQEHQLLESELLLKEYVKKNLDEGSSKQTLVAALATHIEQLKMLDEEGLFFED